MLLRNRLDAPQRSGPEAVEGALEDGLPSIDEDHALVRNAGHFDLTRADTGILGLTTKGRRTVEATVHERTFRFNTPEPSDKTLLPARNPGESISNSSQAPQLPGPG